MMVKFLSISFLLLYSSSFQGQSSEITVENPLKIETSTLKSQHKFIIEKSKTYLNNKVVKIAWIEDFYSNVCDSLKSAKNESANFQKAYLQEKKVSNNALKSVISIEKELQDVNSKKENITFFGSITSKKSYKTIVWIIIISLITFSVVILFKYISSRRTAKYATEKLNEIELQLGETKKKARIKEQELMRKLQDEINNNN